MATRQVQKFFGITGVKPAMSTLLVILPTMLGIWTNFPLSVKIFLLIATGVLAFVSVYSDNIKPRLRVEEMLNIMNLSLWSKNEGHFRANVMVYNEKNKNLSIKYRSNAMIGAIDGYLCIGTNQGCAGEAFTYKRHSVVDLTQQTHEQYKIDPKSVWSSMQCVMSVPICDDEEHKNIVGILNVDTDLDINTANFWDDNVIRVAGAYADWIAKLL